MISANKGTGPIPPKSLGSHVEDEAALSVLYVTTGTGKHGPMLMMWPAAQVAYGTETWPCRAPRPKKRRKKSLAAENVFRTLKFSVGYILKEGMQRGMRMRVGH